MSDIEDLRNRAIDLYQQDDLAGAERLCSEVLRRIADCSITSHLLGLVCLRRGRAGEAVAWFERALATKPNYVEALSNRGAALRQLDRLREALSSYEHVLAIKPADATALNNRGAVLLDMGQFQPALESCDKAIALHPGYVSALSNRGNALRQLKRFEEAVASFDRALAVAPDSIEPRFNRALVLLDLGRFQEAATDFERVLTVDPSDTTALLHRSTALYRAGRPLDALKSYDRLLALSPDFVQALNDRAAVLLALGRFEEALAGFNRVLEIEPRRPSGLSNRGAALRGLGRREEALAALDEALANESRNPVIAYNRGTLLHDLERHEDALKSFDTSLALDPNYAPCWNNRGGTLRSLGRLADALASYDRAIDINTNYMEAWFNRGSLLRELRRPEEALQSYNRALAINPDHMEGLTGRANLLWVAYRDYEGALRDLERAETLDPHYPYLKGDLLHMRMYGARWQDFDEQVAVLDHGVRAGKRIATPFVYQAVCKSPKDLQSCSVRFANDRYPGRQFGEAESQAGPKIRLGYVSGEFKEQATSFLAAGLYERHDRTRFEIVAFDNGRDDGNVMRKRLEAAFDRFIDISLLSDKEAAERIRAENIDILINLNGYFGEARMGVFALKPVPIQVNYLGFPGTLGADYMDYIIADRIVIPEAERGFYNEQVVYMPHCYQVNDCTRRIGDETPSRTDCGLPESGFVFCNFSQSYKFTPSMFGVWMRILHQVEGSVLWLLDNNRNSSQNLRLEAERRGIAAERLVFAPLVPMEDHLARHRLADLFLDSLPCNAHTGASDALWAGLPIVTCQGSTFAGRVVASLLRAIFLPELIADDMEQYEAACLKLARNPASLKEVRERLRKNREVAPLFDTDRYRRNIEAAYVTMWKHHLQGNKPHGFSV